MANKIQEYLSDGFTSLEAGQDAGLPPHLISPNQVSMAINATFRGGNPFPRPGYWQRVLTFPDTPTRTAFETGLFQGASDYHQPDGPPHIIVSISGRIYDIDITGGYTVQDITIPGDPNSSLLDQVWMQNAEGFLIIQNGVNAALIWDGASLRRPDKYIPEVPTGTVMAYVTGRLWIAQGRFFIASDLVGGSTGSVKYGKKDAILKFTENTYLTSGTFTVPMDSGEITAMTSVVSLDTAFGQNDLAVFTPDAVFLVSVPTDRTQWQNLNTPLQRVGLIGFGAVNAAVVTVNGDIWYRSQDGVRSFIMARRDFGMWGNVPMSREMGDLLDDDSEELLPYGSGVLFDNRLLMTISPYNTVGQGVAYKGIAVLDFDLVSRMRGRTAPAWEGAWAGLHIFRLIRLKANRAQRCFALVIGSDSKIALWEITKDSTADNGPAGAAYSTPISWSLALRRWNCGYPKVFKQLNMADLWIDNLHDTVHFQANFRPDRENCWTLWHQWSECAQTLDCSPPNCAPGAPSGNLQPQFRANMRLPKPPETCVPQSRRPVREGYEFQVRLDIVGYCELSMFTIRCLPLETEILAQLPCLSNTNCTFPNPNAPPLISVRCCEPLPMP